MQNLSVVKTNESDNRPSADSIRASLLSAKVKSVVLIALCAIKMAPIYAMEMEIDPITVKEDADANSLFSSLLGLLIFLFKWIGIFLFIWGIGMLGMAIKSDEPESKQKAIMCMVAGIFLFGLKFFLQAVGIIG